MLASNLESKLDRREERWRCQLASSWSLAEDNLTQMCIEEPLLEARNPREVFGSPDEESAIEAEVTHQKGEVSDPVLKALSNNLPWKTMAIKAFSIREKSGSEQSLTDGHVRL